MEPNMRVFLPGDKDYLSTMQQLEEYLLQKYIQKREYQKSGLFVGSGITREQVRRIFPELQNEEELKKFEERYSQDIEISNNLSIPKIGVICRYKMRNNYPVSVPRNLTPEQVCLMQSSQVSYYWLKDAGVSDILDFTTTSATSKERKENLRCSVDAKQGEFGVDL